MPRKYLPAIRAKSRETTIKASVLSADLTTILKLGLTIHSGYLIGKAALNSLKAKTSLDYKIAIDADDDLFLYWMEELGKQIDIDALRNVECEVDWPAIDRMRAKATKFLDSAEEATSSSPAVSGRRNRWQQMSDVAKLYTDVDPTDKFGPFKVIKSTPPSLRSHYYIGDHRIEFSIGTEDEDSPNKSNLVNDGSETLRIKRIRTRLIFTCKNEEERDAIQVRGNELVLEKQTIVRKSEYFQPEGSHWSRITVPIIRDFTNVILPKEQEELLISDLGEFLKQEQFYTKRGIPYHRGYLFHGPPGTGKTSLAQALCQHFKLNLYILPLSGVTSGSTLAMYMNQVRHNSIVVFEDFDVARATESRAKKKEEGKKVDKMESMQGNTLTLSDILNALDGIRTPKGLISIVTTNYIEELDPALVRPGRIDLQLELGYVTEEQFRGMYKLFYEEEYPGTVYPDQIGETTPAALMEVFKKYPYSPYEAVDALPFAKLEPVRIGYRDSCM